MADKPSLSCAEVRERLRPFLADLLSDDEYRHFFAHLETCSACAQYVRSIGDLSNQIWKLGKIKVPSDFAATTLFKLRMIETDGAERKSGMRAIKKAAAAVLLLGAAAFFFVRDHGKSNAPALSPTNPTAAAVNTASTESNTPPALSGPISTINSLSDAQAKSIYEGLKSIASTTERSQTRPPSEASGKKAADTQAIPLMVSSTNTPSDETIYVEEFSFGAPRMVHWHVGALDREKKDALWDTIYEAGGSIDYRSNELVVVSIPGTEIKNLTQHIQALGAALSEFGHLESKGALDNTPIPISIYFTAGDTHDENPGR